MASGHIEQRIAKDGRVSFRCRWDAGTDTRGKRLQGSRTFTAPPNAGVRQIAATRRLAERFLADLAAGEEADPGQLTVGALLEQWLAAREREVEPATVYRYASVIRLHLVGSLGHRKLRGLSALHIERWIAVQLDGGAAPASVRLRLAVLKAALRQAVRWRLLTHSPADGVAPPRAVPGPGRALSLSELAALLAVADRDPHRAFWRVLLFGGLRIGEMLALRWDAVDLSTSAVTVRRTLSSDREGHVTERAGTKTHRERVVILDEATMTALREYRDQARFTVAAAGMTWSDARPVFATVTGRPSHATHWGKRWARLVCAAGLAPVRLHDVRHTQGSRLAEAGVSPAVLAARLGHSPATLLGIYQHADAAGQRAAVEALAASLTSGNVPVAVPTTSPAANASRPNAKAERGA